MKALVYTGTELTEMRDEPAPVAGPGEAIIDLAYCGICGSDMHAWHGHDARRVPPLVLGHEAVGVVATGPMTGKRVAINPLMSCGTCKACRTGAEHLCPTRELVGMRVPGAFSEQIAVPEANLTVLPDGLGFEDAVLAEPLACAVHTARLGLKALNVPPAEAKTVVLGGGAIGLLCALVLRLSGIEDLSIAETNPVRRTLLEDCTGARAYDPVSGSPADGSVDLVVDAVGSGRTRAAASALAAPGGVIAHIGLQDSEAGLDTRRLTLQEITFVGTYCYTRADFAEAVRLLGEGKISRDGWSTIRPLEAGVQSFIDIHTGQAPPKIILNTRV